MISGTFRFPRWLEAEAFYDFSYSSATEQWSVVLKTRTRGLVSGFGDSLAAAALDANKVRSQNTRKSADQS